MAGLLIALGVIVVMAMGVGCIVLEFRLARQGHPARFLLSWLAWGVTLWLGAWLLIWATGGGIGGGLGWGFLIGLMGYPVVRARFGADDWQAKASQRYAEELKRLRYKATDFGGTAAPKKADAVRPGAKTSPAAPAVTMTPLTPLPAHSVLAQVSADKRPLWARATEQGLLALVIAAGIALLLIFTVINRRDRYEPRDTAAAEAAVAETLEMNGFAAPRLRRQWLTIHCKYNSAAYRWSAMGAEGRACACFDDGEITVKVDRSWGRLPTPFERMGGPAPTPEGTPGPPAR